MFFEGTHYRWLADENSVEYLDLCTRKFEEKPNTTTAIYALNLCAAPRRYNYPPWYSLQPGEHLPLLETYSFITYGESISSKKLIEVFRLGAETRTANFLRNAASSSFFSDFSTNILKRLATNYEPETVSLYIKHVAAYLHYFKKSLFHAHINSNPILVTYERPPTVCYQRSGVPSFIITQTALKLMKLLFENLCADSSVVAELFHTMFIHYEPKYDLLFRCEAKVTEYIFYHLRKANSSYLGDVVEAFDYSYYHPVWDSLIRSNPEHLLALLNSGIKITIRPITHLFFPCLFKQLHPVNLVFVTTFIPNFLVRGWSFQTPREAAIWEIIRYFFGFSAPYCTIYLACQRYIWRSIPDAFISYEEIRNLLVRNIDATVVEDICDQLQDSEIDCFDVVLQPRSLLHYSRCALRDALMCSFQLPDGIPFLGLPKRLESYLRLEL